MHTDSDILIALPANGVLDLVRALNLQTTAPAHRIADAVLAVLPLVVGEATEGGTRAQWVDSLKWAVMDRLVWLELAEKRAKRRGTA